MKAFRSNGARWHAPTGVELAHQMFDDPYALTLFYGSRSAEFIPLGLRPDEEVYAARVVSVSTALGLYWRSGRAHALYAAKVIA